MILYFSGTGNSEYAAKRIGKEIGDEVTNLFEGSETMTFQPCALTGRGLSSHPPMHGESPAFCMHGWKRLRCPAAERFIFS